MMSRLASFLPDQRGATAVEIGVLAPLLFVTVLSTFDLGLYFWRWNEAIQASRIGARIATVSDPVSSDLKTMTGMETGAEMGEPAGAYERVCTAGACSGGSYDAAAMNTLFYGVQGSSCTPGSPKPEKGMCDVLPVLQSSNVTVIYRSSGVDTAGAAGSLRPLVTVRIRGANPRLVLFGKLLPASLPATETTMLAEDLRSTA